MIKNLEGMTNQLPRLFMEDQINRGAEFILNANSALHTLKNVGMHVWVQQLRLQHLAR